jgi:hypothetical protein
VKGEFDPLNLQSLKMMSIAAGGIFVTAYIA